MYRSKVGFWSNSLTDNEYKTVFSITVSFNSYLDKNQLSVVCASSKGVHTSLKADSLPGLPWALDNQQARALIG